MKTNKLFAPRQSFLRVATATPEVSIADIKTNTSRIEVLFTRASNQHVALVVFPELSITGYTIQDLVQQPQLLIDARHALVTLALFTKGTQTAAVVGLPLAIGNAIYNTAALLADGQIKGIVPKLNLPTYNEFYEKRWYQAWGEQPNISIAIDGQKVSFGRDQLFEIAGQLVGIEICEDLWVPDQPSTYLVKNGATIIVNPSASPETVAKSSYRRGLISFTAAREVAGYVYSGADQTESTAEVVMSGHALINELGTTLAERIPFSLPQPLLIADIDTEHIIHDRQKSTNFPNTFTITPTATSIVATQTDLRRAVDASPFIPKGSDSDIHERLDTILNIQATGLAMRARSANIKKVVLGLSGGLDSTLALLIAVRAAGILGMTSKNFIHTLTMPGYSSSDRTQNNAMELARSLAISNEEIPIAKLSNDQLKALKHNDTQDITYENTQARVRQALVFNKANQLSGLALGTGDLSEIALGWCTYNGDHMSHYNVNASIPKTLVRSLTRHAAQRLPELSQEIIYDILDTPVSPELTGNGNDISQSTEDLVGPYELHDFFLYHFLRWMESPEKIYYLATVAFTNVYDSATIRKWLDVFLQRFYANQWKRQAMPDGPKVGINLSPKGDWRMPPDVILRPSL